MLYEWDLLLSRCRQTRPRFFSSRPLRLALPTVLFSNNHLLAVNKPAGWHSIPLENNKGSRKCLLSWLKRQSLGGGSRHDFLLPLHRLDQPCSGVLLLAKTSKAASRITKVWKKHKVMKLYVCVMSSDRDLEALKRQSRRVHDDCYELNGVMARSRRRGSVSMMPRSWNDESGIIMQSRSYNSSMMTFERGDGSSVHSASPRLCTIQWRTRQSLGSNPMIEVQTLQGARHMVRSMLGQVGHAPICGDVRYGASQPLPDRSVALHASQVTLPDSLVLPLDQHNFVSPLPVEWESWFG